MSMTIGVLWDRVVALTLAQGYVQANEPFNFDLQPSQALDRMFVISSDRVGTEGYMGGDQAEQHQFVVFLAQRVKRNGWGAARQLKVDLDTLEQAIGDDYPAYDYHLLDDRIESQVQPPAADRDFVIGRLQATLEFEHDLS